MTAPADFAQPYRIITYAYIDAGLIPEGEVPDSSKLASGMNRLNDMINLWGTQGLKLWTYKDQAITLTAGTNTYYLGPAGSIITVKPLRAIQGYYLTTVGSQNRRPIYPLSWDDWLTLSTINTQGEIAQYFVNKQRANLEVSFWLTPDSNAASNGEAHLLIPRQIENFTGLTDTMDFPQEWFMGLRWGLADELSVGQPEAIMNRCAQRALQYRTMLEDWDVEDAPTVFQPDTMQGNSGMSQSFV